MAKQVKTTSLTMRSRHGTPHSGTSRAQVPCNGTVPLSMAPAVAPLAGVSRYRTSRGDSSHYHAHAI